MLGLEVGNIYECIMLPYNAIIITYLTPFIRCSLVFLGLLLLY